MVLGPTQPANVLRQVPPKEIERGKGRSGESMLYKRGRVWWYSFWFDGERYQKSTKVRSKDDAATIERAFRTSLAKEEVGLRPKRKLRYEDLALGIGKDWRKNNRRDIKSLAGRLSHLGKFFGGRRADTITARDVNAYVESRPTEKAANATVNRELSALKRMFNLALKDDELDSMPHISMLDESPPRPGFFDESRFAAVLAALPDHLKPVAEFACLTGWRRSEVTSLGWDQVDLKERSVRIWAGMDKNKKGRFLPLEGELWRIVQEQRKTVGCPYVFHNHGRRIRTFYKAWATACREAGCPCMLFHDFRRTAARNLTRDGLSEEQAMTITGHKTASVFRRYNIVTEGDIRRAVCATGAFADSSVEKTEETASQ
jgi:integrase